MIPTTLTTKPKTQPNKSFEDAPEKDTGSALEFGASLLSINLFIFPLSIQKKAAQSKGSTPFKSLTHQIKSDEKF